MTKLYLISYRPLLNFNSSTFHKYVEAMYSKGWFTDWWHYTDNAYIVASTYDVQKLYDAAAPGMAGIQYVLIVEIDPKNAQGWLPADAWKWLQKYKN